MSKKKNAKYVLFWIKSVKGTDRKEIFKIPADWHGKDIKGALESWCSKFGAWEASENIISYGWKPLKVPNRRELEKKYDLVCKRRKKINEKWQILAAMFNITKL